MKQYVDRWDDEDDEEEQIDPQTWQVHVNVDFRGYLAWYQPRTRCWLTHAAPQQPGVHVPTLSDTYAYHRDEQLAAAVSFMNCTSVFTKLSMCCLIICIFFSCRPTFP